MYYIHYTAIVVMATLFFWPEYPFNTGDGRTSCWWHFGKQASLFALFWWRGISNLSTHVYLFLHTLRRRLWNQVGLVQLPIAVILSCVPDYGKINEPISLKLGVVTRPTKRKNWLIFSGALVPDADFRMITFPLPSPLRNRGFLKRFIGIYNHRRFSRHSAKWLSPTKKWIHILGAIR